MEEGVGVGEGVEAGEDITLSLCVPCEFLSFRLRNLLIVLILDQVCQKKVGRSRLGCMYSGPLPDNPHATALRRESRGCRQWAMNTQVIAVKIILN